MAKRADTHSHIYHLEGANIVITTLVTWGPALNGPIVVSNCESCLRPTFNWSRRLALRFRAILPPLRLSLPQANYNRLENDDSEAAPIWLMSKFCPSSAGSLPGPSFEVKLNTQIETYWNTGGSEGHASSGPAVNLLLVFANDQTEAICSN